MPGYFGGSGLALNLNLLDICLLGSWDYRYESLSQPNFRFLASDELLLFLGVDGNAGDLVTAMALG
jgi:hypothetical protein